MNHELSSEVAAGNPPQSGSRSRKLRVLIVSDYGYLAGGAEVFVHNMAGELKRRGHQVRIFASTAGRGQGKPLIADEWCYGTTAPVRTIVQSANPWAAWALRKSLAAFRPDVVHLNIFLTQLSPLILNEVRDWPVIYTAHWYRAICMTGFKMLPGGGSCRQRAGIACLKERCVSLRDWLPLSIQLNALNRKRGAFSKVVAASATIRSRLESDGFPVDRTIRYGVRELAPRLALQTPPRVGFAARLVAEKGGAVLLQAFQRVVEQIPGAVLDVFGDGPELPALRQQAESLGIDGQVHFHGYLAQDELQRRLARAWVQAAPSLFEEPAGIVGYEAAMRGTAMVASNYGGFAYTVVAGKTGFLTPPGDVPELTKALLALLSDKGRAEEYGNAGQRLAKEQFTINRMVDQYLDLYHEVIRTCETKPGKAEGKSRTF